MPETLPKTDTPEVWTDNVADLYYCVSPCHVSLDLPTAAWIEVLNRIGNDVYDRDAAAKALSHFDIKYYEYLDDAWNAVLGCSTPRDAELDDLYQNEDVIAATSIEEEDGYSGILVIKLI